VRSFTIQILSLMALLASGCEHGVTPALPFHAQEGAATVGGESTRLDVAAGGGLGACCGWVGGGGGGAIRVRHGIGDDVEVGASLSGMYMHLDVQDGRYPPGMWLSGKLEAKYRLAPPVALVTGAGGGFSPQSSFLGLDLGVIVGRPEPRVVDPYGQLRLSFSAPVGPSRLLDTEDGSGVVEPALYVLGGTGLLIHIGSRAKLALEVGGGTILVPSTGQNGGAIYALVGIGTRLGPEE